jgi:alcohol dehydrogenase
MAATISAKSEIIFGEHSSYQIGARTKRLGCKKVLCIYDKGIKKAGIVDPIINNIENTGQKVVHYDGVQEDPPDNTINECGELANKEKVDAIVGIGGGSPMDTAKAVNILLGNPGPIQRYFARGAKSGPGKPLILIPTTAGTGSEITHMCVITNTAAKTKVGASGPATIAKLAIVDPSLTLGLPPHITAATGMDTFAHALEAYTSTGENIMSDMLAEKAIELVYNYLPKAVKNGSDIVVRTKMSFASLIAGASFNDAIPHFGHAFGHTLGAFHHVPHGTGCAIALPGVVEIAADVMPNKVRRVGELMGMKLAENLTPAALGKKVAKRIITFNKKIGIQTLKELKVKESDLPKLAKGTMADGCFYLLPKRLGFQDVMDIINQAYAI